MPAPSPVTPSAFDAGFGSRLQAALQAASPLLPLPTEDELIQLAVAAAVVRQLRHPQTGCPWDVKQTHESLRPYLIEESHEVLEAITLGLPAAICEELGDVLLQVLLHAQIALEAETFSLASVAQGLAEKLIRRHPHVFETPAGESEIRSSEAVTQQWQQIKATEKAAQGVAPATQASAIDGVAASLPTLMQAAKVSRKAVKVGFAWPDDATLWDCVQSEYTEFLVEARRAERHPAAMEEELGDMLFATCTLAQHYGIDPEVALVAAVQKFKRRFHAMEALAGDTLLTTLSFDEWESLWQTAKRQLA